jgi:ribosome-binding factor A
MNESLRQKKVASLIQATLSSQFTHLFQDISAGLVTVTRVEMTKDLKTARVYFSVLGKLDDDSVLHRLENRQGTLRKAVASRTKLKYNPKLIFLRDLAFDHAERIDELLNDMKKNER